MVNVLGIDPGMTNLGWSSVIYENEVLSLGLSGLIANPRDTAVLFNEYLNHGIEQITEKFPVILSLVTPSFIAAETVPSGRLGSRTELVVAAITSCKVIAFQWGIPWYDIAANTVKKTVTGDGTATKARVRNAVIERFPEIGINHAAIKKDQKEAGEKPIGIIQDVFDAVGIAITGWEKYGSD
jgi:Holliday junction resolvasome RuvABC endonuclease subunit